MLLPPEGEAVEGQSSIVLGAIPERRSDSHRAVSLTRFSGHLTCGETSRHERSLDARPYPS